MLGQLLSPPIAFAALLLLFLALNHAVRPLAAQGRASKRKPEPAPGGPDADHSQAPDYGGFYAFSLFFTVMLVMVLVVSSAPAGELTLPLLYVAVGGLSLLIIFGR